VRWVGARRLTYYRMSHMGRETPIRPPALHELEAEVMEEVWRQGSATVRDVLVALNAREERQRAYTTIMTIMARLERKGVLERHKEGKGFVYTPSASRDEYLDSRAQAEVEALVEEYGELALVHFARAMERLDPDWRRRLRRLARRA
jgi:BlaI family transcriptional regulator, penicillinase repressor